MKLKQLIIAFFIVCLFSSCEQKNIDTEIKRLQRLEKELVKSISEKNTERAKLLCIQMKWEYVATTVGADVKCKKLAEIWDDKRRNYLIAFSMCLNKISLVYSSNLPYCHEPHKMVGIFLLLISE